MTKDQALRVLAAFYAFECRSITYHKKHHAQRYARAMLQAGYRYKVQGSDKIGYYLKRA